MGKPDFRMNIRKIGMWKEVKVGLRGIEPPTCGLGKTTFLACLKRISIRPQGLRQAISRTGL